MPVPALITWTSPASVRPSLPRLSLCVTALSRHDFHVGVRVGRKARVRHDLVIVPDASEPLPIRVASPTRRTKSGAWPSASRDRPLQIC
jgi:hypothetical protein